jgi:hypothetical protein
LRKGVGSGDHENPQIWCIFFLSLKYSAINIKCHTWLQKFCRLLLQNFALNWDLLLFCVFTLAKAIVLSQTYSSIYWEN